MGKVKELVTEKKPFKVKKDELEKINSITKRIGALESAIGRIEVEKSMYVNEMFAAKQHYAKIQNEIKEKYGDVNIDLITGKITENKPQNGQSN